MIRFQTALGSAAMALCLASPAHAAVIFKGAQITSNTSVSATAKGVGTGQNNSKTVNKKNLPSAPMIATSTSNGSAKIGTKTAITATATTTSTANFINASSGSFDATSSNTIVQPLATSRTNPLLSGASAGAYTFNYSFTTTQHSKLTLDYNLFDPNAAANSFVTASLKGGVGNFVTTLAANTAGSISSILYPGDYMLTLNTALGDSRDYMDRIGRYNLGVGTSSGFSSDHFSFTVAPVPEPATWALMIVGLGFVGAALRRKGSRLALA